MRGERLMVANKIAKKRFEKSQKIRIANADKDWWYKDHPNDLYRHMGILRKVTKHCSSPYCCGNPRRRGELTRQERKFLEAYYDY